jgi:SNF2 family DNA or RNA helicase
MAIKLFKHQEEGVDFFLQNKKVCLFYEAGTGKTFIALDALTKLPAGRVLIVAPKRVLEQVWKIDDNYDISKHNVTYLNYEKIARDKDFTKNTWDYIILDEVHKLKGRTTKTSKKFSVVCKRARYVLGLTGTPIANSYVDIYNIYKHCDINEFDMSCDEFIYRYYYYKLLDSSSGYKFPMLIAPKPMFLKELMDRIARHSKTKRLLECVDFLQEPLPPRLIYVEGMVNKTYEELKRGIFRTESYSKTMIPLERINKQHQAANGFVYDDFGDAISICENKKLKILSELLSDLLEETERVIIVYQYKEDLNNLKTLEYDWTTNPEEFPNKQILFLQFAQSEGLNLQYCSNMIFYSYDYSFLNYEQITRRIFRIGQNKRVNYTILISKGTIEEKIWWAIKNKKSTDEFLKECIGGYDGEFD